ncbi:type II toxin-antitoxin system HigB family toxin [Acaryochloris sp. IP29b_bin.137]|uniref:type II toxin-antitoxin system HigB family toxin n=1 Tax=Acaryochloris sp. IP29b_bin.137 TaxID=2969217 RepID=UPI002606C33F|nr:type II toxin-antitoxin system HigB family toxin [Acaryochloris sp. IP29b_bin.137]
MHVITKSRLVRFWENHPTSKSSLLLWFRLTTQAHWNNFVELRQVFPSADQVKNFTVFDIGRSHRLITLVDYQYQKIFIRHVLTHAEYDKEDWKKDKWFDN